MADGITHNKYLRMGWYIIIPLGLILWIINSYFENSNSFLYVLFLYINFLLCEVIDPDADQLSLTSSEGRILRFTRKFYLGFLGALFVAYTFIYAYIIGLFGGHRSPLSHGVLIGTIGRMIFYNIPVIFLFYGIYSYGLVNWSWIPTVNVYYSFAMEKWFPQYLFTQFTAWFIGDGIHLILDTEWAKGRLYEYKSIKKSKDNK